MQVTNQDARSLQMEKAQLNVQGGQQEHGVHYWDTYAPVVTWQMVRFFLILSILLG